MMKLSMIAVRGRYTGVNRRGIVVGGTPLLPNMPATHMSVTEDTYKFLLEGVKSGWFKIDRDNYSEFCITRDREKFVSPAEPDEESQNQESEVKKKPIVKKSTKKKEVEE